MTTLNLDTAAVRAAQGILESLKSVEPKALENLTTRSLGVLQENGVFACCFFLESRSGKEREPAGRVLEGLTELSNGPLGVLPAVEPDPPDAPLSDRLAESAVADDLQTLLLVKSVWEQALVYLRYGAKARGRR